MFRQTALAACMAMFAAPCVALAAPSAPSQATAPPFAASPATPKSDHSGTPGQDRDKTLTESLAQSNGTIKPPPVDRGIVKQPPPTAGTMPVLKPPSHQQSK